MADDAADDAADNRWTVRGIPKAVRDAAADAAQRGKVPVGAWLCESISRSIQAEREPLDLLLPRPADKSSDMSDAGGGRPDFAALRDMMQAAQAVAMASGVPMNKRTALRFNRLVDDHVRGAAGLPPRKPRPAVQRIGRSGAASAAEP